MASSALFLLLSILDVFDTRLDIFDNEVLGTNRQILHQSTPPSNKTQEDSIDCIIPRLSSDFLHFCILASALPDWVCSAAAAASSLDTDILPPPNQSLTHDPSLSVIVSVSVGLSPRLISDSPASTHNSPPSTPGICLRIGYSHSFERGITLTVHDKQTSSVFSLGRSTT